MSGKKQLIITRFPPEPSGYLHVGHLKAIYHNLTTANRKKGHCLFRFDDTNPSTSNQHYVDNIISVLDKYGILKQFSNGDNPSYASNYFQQLLDCMEQLIQQGDAYIDESSSEEISKLRSLFKPSPFRDTSIDDNISKWYDFIAGKLPNAVVRLKISYNNPNGSLRDPITYRTNTVIHYRTGDKFKVYPTYDFACPIVDSLDGVTLAQRTNEFTDKNDLMKWIFKKLPQLNKVIYKSYSRLVMEYSILSKRKIRQLIETNIVEDWNDPRLDTLVAELRKGILPISWETYFIKHGVSNSNNIEEWDKILNINRKIIDTTSRRIMALSQYVYNVDIVDFNEENNVKSVPWSPKDITGKLGNKEIQLSSKLYVDEQDAKLINNNDLVYLLNFMAVRVINIDHEKKTIDVRCHKEEFQFKDIPHKISWLTQDEFNNLSPVTTTYYDYIINTQHLTKEDNIDDYLNHNSKTTIPLSLSQNQKYLGKGDIIQLLRFGFYIVDNVEPLNLVYIREPGNKKQYLLDERIKF